MTPFECNHNGECESVRICCTDTEMTLTRKDVKRIETLGYSKADYLFRTDDGFCQLRNIDGYCYFYEKETKTCKIYESRPDGCRYYPIIYDMKKRKCVVDKDCPSRETMTRLEVRKQCHKVRTLVEKLRMEALYNEKPC